MRFLKNLALVAGGVRFVYFGGVTVLTVLYIQMDPPVSSLMVLRSVQGVKVQPSRPLPLSQIPPFARKAIVYLEDHAFWEHRGIVWGAIREAWEANQEAGRPERGGSTITQQLARTLFLFPERMYLRKALEAGTALILEAILTKERIMELYFNNIEWGPGIFGIEAGARYHFGVGVRELNREKLSRLEAIITNPVAFDVKTFTQNRGMKARYRALMEW